MVPVNRENDAKVLEVLTGLAEAGARCLTNPAIGDLIGLTTNQVEWSIRRLRDKRLIRTESVAGIRRIEIVGTGKSTDWTRPRDKIPGTDAPVTGDNQEKRLVNLMRIIDNSIRAGENLSRIEDIAIEALCSYQTVYRDLRSLVARGEIILGAADGARYVERVATGERAWRKSHRRRPKSFVKSGGADSSGGDEVGDDAPGYTTLVPCARYGCGEFVGHMKAYCDYHDAGA